MLRRQLSIDEGLINQIRGTHVPEGDETDYEPILKIAEEIFTLAMAEVKLLVQPQNAEARKEEESEKDGDSTLSDDIATKINTYTPFFEQVYSSDDNVHSKTMLVLKKMSSLSWEVKLALSLAGAALKYGEFSRLAKGYLSDELPPAMSRLRGMTENRKNKLKQRLDDINSYITSLLTLFKSFVKLTQLLTQSSSREEEYRRASNIRNLAGYWIIGGAITCTRFVASKTNPGLGGPTFWELYVLRRQIDVMETDIQSQIKLWSNIIEEEKKKEAYNELAKMIDGDHENNLEVLKVLIPAQGDEPPLYDDSNKAMEVPLDVLSKKTVLLLISKVDIAQNQDKLFLSDIYGGSRSSGAATENRYEVIWFPVWDNSHDTESTFRSNRTTMQWYSVKHPEKVDHNVLELVKKKFHYHDEPILVVLDPNGNVVNDNAFDMMWTWGDRAFPFSKTTEEALWKKIEKLRLDLIVMNGPCADIENWVKDEKYIIVYGGDEVEWINKFVNTTENVKQKAMIPLEILYVGMSNRKERATRILNWMKMKDNEVGHFLAEIDILFFWNRLEHMERSKIKGKGNTNVGEDPILQGLMKLLSYDQNGSWAALFKGAELVVIGHGDPVLVTMDKYCDEWKENTNKGFDTAFKEYFDTAFKEYFDKNKEIDIYSTRVVLPSNFEETIGVLKCCECNRNMAKHIMFNCSHGH